MKRGVERKVGERGEERRQRGDSEKEGGRSKLSFVKIKQMPE
jgi:hypothetical protein